MITCAQLGAPQFGAGADYCSVIPDEQVRTACQMLQIGPDAFAQYVAATGGAAACAAIGLPSLSPLCAAAASAVSNWLFAGYTPMERAELLYRASASTTSPDLNKKRRAALLAIDGFVHQQQILGESQSRSEARSAIVRANVALLGVGAPWNMPRASGVATILMGMVAQGVADRPLGWWARPRKKSDLHPLPKAGAPPAPPPPKYPAGSVARFNRQRNMFSIYAPVGVHGLGQTADPSVPPAGTVKIAEEKRLPPGVPLIGEEGEEAVPLYKKPLFWVAVGGGIVLIGGGVALARTKKRR